MSKYEQLWLIAFSKTQLIEVTVGVLILLAYSTRHASLKLRFSHCCVTIFTATAITHPLLWFVFPRWRRALGMSYDEYVLYGEFLVFLMEALWYWSALEYTKRRILAAAALSLSLNSASYFIGVYLW